MSEVPGRKSALLTAGSNDSKYCRVCPAVKASAYCMQCKIYICPACVGHHKVLPATASHKLLTEDKFPMFYQTGHDEDIKQCPDHPDEEIKFYCPSHNALCCCACNVLEHDQCKKDYIPQISKDFLKSQDYTELKEEIQSSEDQIKNCFINIDQCLKAVQNINDNAIEQFTKYKALVIAYLNQREKELLMDLKAIRDQDTAALKVLKATAETIQSDLSKAKTNLRLHKNNSHELFIATKRTRALLTNLQSAIDKLADKSVYRYVELQKDQVVEKLLTNEKGLAHVRLRSWSDMSTAVFQRQADLKFVTEERYINDIAVVTPDTLLLSNQTEKNVQLINTRTGRALSVVSMQGEPWGLCLTRSDQAAVVVEENIQMLDVNGQTLTKSTVLKLKHPLHGITTLGDTSFVLSYTVSPWLEVFTTDGKVSHQFDKDGTTQHFQEPDFLTTSVDNLIYVSDHGTNTITRLNSSLQLLQTFSSPLLSRPRGIFSISPDQLLVCSYYNDRIVLLNTSTGKSSILLREQAGIYRPWSLSYCPEQTKLYVAKHFTNKLNVYRLT